MERLERVQVIELGLDRVHPGRWQPRDRELITDESLAELAADIKQRGIINPLIGVPLKQDGPIEVELIAGERRWRAAKLAKLYNVPVRIVRGDEDELLEMAIVDNLQREDLTPVEEGRALQQLQDLHGYSQRQLASHLHKSQPWVQQRLALLGAAEGVRALVNTRVFNLAHVRALSGLPDAVQEAAAGHLAAKQERGVPLTSRQAAGLARRVRQFLDPGRFVGAEEAVTSPAERNLTIALRYALETLPEETLGAAVTRLLQEDDQQTRALLGRKEPGEEEMRTLLALLDGPEAWTGYYHRAAVSQWWTQEVATATGRTCEMCLLQGVAPPTDTYEGWEPPCVWWGNPDASPMSCEGCIVEGDAVLVPFNVYSEYAPEDEAIVHEGYAWFVTSIADYERLVGVAAAMQRQVEGTQAASVVDANRERLEGFRALCTAGEDVEEGAMSAPLLDVDHFQAQYCERCVFGGDRDCAFIEDPIGDRWDRRPGLWGWVKLEMGQDNDGKKIHTAARVVPRCEMFRWAIEPALHPLGFLTFPKSGPKRRNTVIRWLKALIGGFTQQRSYGGRGLWSPLRWLPYGRHPGKHYQLDALLAYVLQSWDTWGDARIGTLLNAAASEVSALTDRNRGPSNSIYNPETGKEERWIPVDWQRNYVAGRKPFDWPKDVEWPFAEAEAG